MVGMLASTNEAKDGKKLRLATPVPFYSTLKSHLKPPTTQPQTLKKIWKLNL
jgi:hypothetical protein